jgi:hypothetical protein
MEIELFEINKEPVKRTAGRVPWGFELDANDPARIVPNIALLEVLEEGIRYRLAGYSARECAAWISSRTGRDIDHRVLDRRIAKERRMYRERQKALPRLIPQVA